MYRYHARAGSGAGAPVFESFLATHRALFPAFVRELEGLAAGASLPFATVFALNLREELGYFAPPPVPTAREAAFADHCTDYALPPWLAHNEDSAASDRGTVFLAEVAIDGGEFVAFTYAGELPSGAFGWNGAVAFTLNYVQPARGALGGVGRAFASRFRKPASSEDTRRRDRDSHRAGRSRVLDGFRRAARGALARRGPPRRRAPGPRCGSQLPDRRPALRPRL